MKDLASEHTRHLCWPKNRYWSHPRWLVHEKDDFLQKFYSSRFGEIWKTSLSQLVRDTALEKIWHSPKLTWIVSATKSSSSLLHSQAPNKRAISHRRKFHARAECKRQRWRMWTPTMLCDDVGKAPYCERVHFHCKQLGKGWWVKPMEESWNICKSNLKKINPQRKTIKTSHFGDWKWLFTFEKICRPVLQQNAWQNSDSGHIIDGRKSSQNQLIWYLSHDLHNALPVLYFSQLPFFPQLLTAGSGPAKDPPTWGYLADATFGHWEWIVLFFCKNWVGGLLTMVNLAWIFTVSFCCQSGCSIVCCQVGLFTWE